MIIVRSFENTSPATWRDAEIITAGGANKLSGSESRHKKISSSCSIQNLAGEMKMLTISSSIKTLSAVPFAGYEDDTLNKGSFTCAISQAFCSLFFTCIAATG